MTAKPPSQSDFIRECQRLHDAQTAAVKAGDTEGYQAASDDLALFLRYNAAGRLGEYFEMRKAQHG